MNNNNYLKIGIIKKPHGIRGELKVLPLTDNPARYKKLKKVYTAAGSAVDHDDYSTITEHTIERLRITPSDVIITFEGFTSRSDIESLRSHYILIDREYGEELGEWEFYSQDLVGCEVYFDNQKVGTVFNLLNTGANDNLEIKTVNNKDIVYPFLREFIESVEINEKKIVINEYEGFFD